MVFVSIWTRFVKILFEGEAAVFVSLFFFFFFHLCGLSKKLNRFICSSVWLGNPGLNFEILFCFEF